MKLCALLLSCASLLTCGLRFWKIEDKAVSNTVPETVAEEIAPPESAAETVAETDAETAAEQPKAAKHLYPEVEMEILRLCNAERERVGLEPLVWYEDAYSFAVVRAEETGEVFSHTRPDGRRWYTVYSDGGFDLMGRIGENLYEATSVEIEEFAARAISAWMSSEGHSANILSSNYTMTSIAVCRDGNAIRVVQNFFG